MLPKPLRALWGDLSSDEVKKFSILGIAFFLIIGTYWMLRVLKVPIFSRFIGVKYIPYAKFISLLFVAGAVIIYSKLIDLCQRRSLLYIICSFYGVGFTALAYVMANPDMITFAPTSYIGSLFTWIPGKAIGWFMYCFLESFGSIVPALFWSFVASSTTTDSAKRGYAMIFAMGQIGNILGPSIVVGYAQTLGLDLIFGIGGILSLLIPFVIKWYVAAVPQEASITVHDNQESQTGLLEGLRLLITTPYVMGIFAVATLYEIIGTMLEFQLNMLGEQMYPIKTDFAWFDGLYGVMVGILAFLFALLGTSFFLRTYGLRFCLISFPAIIGIVMVSVFLAHSSGVSLYQLMWISFAAMVIIKGLNYTLNQPTKEILYIPTSKDIKFKAKGWIDGVGNRSSKTLGSVATASLGYSLPVLLFYGTIASLGIVALWIFIAMAVGNTFNMLQKEQKIIE
jgi:AAA family ATP:ADP antiporter